MNIEGVKRMANKQSRIIKEVAEKLKNEKDRLVVMSPEENERRIKELKKQIKEEYDRLLGTPDDKLTAEEIEKKRLMIKLNIKEML